MTKKILLWVGGGLLVLALVLVGGGWFLLRDVTVNLPIAGTLFGADAPDEQSLTRLSASSGFDVTLFSDDAVQARMIEVTSTGDLIVSSRADQIMLVRADRDGDGKSDGSEILLDDLDSPHGVALRDGYLYVAETGAISRYLFDDATGAVTGDAELLLDNLFPGGGHWIKTIHFGPDGKLYITGGSSCNVCVEEDPRRASMMRMNADGSGFEVYATGLRNAVDFGWQPGTGALYATDNGRDLLGDDFPPCELNLIEVGGFYGWPYANGDRIPDPDFGPGNQDRIEESIPPRHEFGAHTAPLGITFLNPETAPPGYENSAIVALHGSWNRSELSGYKLVSLHWHDDGSIEERDFLTGFEVDEDVIGRPVAVAQASNGDLYITDDYAGVIYRVTWKGGAT